MTASRWCSWSPGRRDFSRRKPGGRRPDQAEIAVYDAERGLTGVKGAVKKREMGAGDFVRKLEGLLFYLRYGKRPDGLLDEEFYSLRILAENLISKGRFKPEAIDIFNK